jgi:hypothetical protein
VRRLGFVGEILQVVNWYENQKLLTAPLLGVKGVLVHLLLRGRNAWNSTWIRNYQGPKGLYANRSEAEIGAEDQRTQGSVFYVYEVPGISLMSEVGPVVLIDFHTDNCFGKWSDSHKESVLRLGTPLNVLMHSLGPLGNWEKPEPSEHSFVCGLANFGTLSPLPARRPLVTYQSQAVGVDFYLRWKSRPNGYSRRGVNSITRIFGSVNDEQERADAEAKYWRAAEHYRESVLGDLLNFEPGTINSESRTPLE